MVSVYKQIYRYTHTRGYRHNENFWPHLKIKRSAAGDITHLSYHGQNINLVNLEQLRQQRQNPLLLVASGPSVNTIAFHQLPKMDSMGVNGAYQLLLPHRYQLYVISDRDFIAKRADITADIIADENLLLFTTTACLVDIINRFSSTIVRCHIAIIEDVEEKTYQKRIQRNDFNELLKSSIDKGIYSISDQVGFSHDIRHGVFDAATVTYWALQIAIYLGYEVIYIAGLDMNNFEQPRFYENVTNKQPTLLAKNFSNLILPSFQYASQIIRQRGREVYNLSLHSALDDSIFPKIAYQSLISKE